METAYLSCALIGGTLIVCQFLLTLLGLGGHHDTGGGHDVAEHEFGGHDSGALDTSGHDADGHDAAHDHTGHGGAASWFLSVLTFRTLTAGAALFGLTGMLLTRCDVGAEVALGGAILAGLAALFTVRWLMGNLTRLNIDATVPIRRAVGAAGIVYLSIPARQAGAGKVHVSVAGRLIEYKAVSAHDDLPTGAKIMVVGVVDQDTVAVEPVHARLEEHP